MRECKNYKETLLHWLGVEPRSAAWKVAMLTVTPPMLTVTPPMLTVTPPMLTVTPPMLTVTPPMLIKCYTVTVTPPMHRHTV